MTQLLDPLFLLLVQMCPVLLTIKGPISNTAILFQVTSSPNNYVKTGWEGGNPSCNGIYFQTTADETSLTKSWTSPTDTAVTSVTISAYVKTADNKISMATIDLSNGDSTTPPTTVATTATTRDTTSATISTTSSASTLLSSYTILGIIQVMALVFLCHLTS
uniref:Integumentary mucin C.1-like isoform X2 n=1 Tax=Geotrypetes seraphini TaxID=260995 RepID=A0A6P8NRJ7_GEOSA|nr:integumentary mucin C.1-like isoform X2 [Geotrypetes seraphini]